MSEIFVISKAIQANQGNADNTPLPKLLFSEDLSRITGLSLSTIRHYTGNADQFGHMLPRWFKLPGARRLVWLPEDVAEWVQRAQSLTQKPNRRRGRPTKAEQVALRNHELVPTVENKSSDDPLGLTHENTAGAQHDTD